MTLAYVLHFLGGLFLGNAIPHFGERRDGTGVSKPVRFFIALVAARLFGPLHGGDPKG